jgi:hypothetical protein
VYADAPTTTHGMLREEAPHRTHSMTHAAATRRYCPPRAKERLEA